MGCWYSRLDSHEMVSRCKARRRYMKQLVKARHAFCAAHSMYLRSLRNTGAALLQFATVESNLHHRNVPPLQASAPPQIPTPPCPVSPASWTNASTTTSSTVRPPPPPPPISPSACTWDFWDPFMPNSERSVDEEVWEETTATSEVPATTTTTARVESIAAPPSVVTATATTSSSELAVVVSAKSKDLVEVIKELDDYFLKAANAGGPLSLLLEVPICNLNRQASGNDFGSARASLPFVRAFSSRSARWNGFGKFCEDPIGYNKAGSVVAEGNVTHCATLERLYAWEKKLYHEVKTAEYLKLEHERKSAILRKLEIKNSDYMKTEKAKKELDKLESQLMVALQAFETTSAEIIKVRESQLYPQLIQIANGLTSMWRRMYEFHQVQTQIVQQLKYLNCSISSVPTSEIHRQSTLQLELEAQQWHLSFCNLVKVQRDYIQSLMGWLRLSLFRLGNNPLLKTKQDSAVYSFCEEWQLAVNNIPDKVASEGLKSFLSMIHSIVAQQEEEQKQKKRAESVFKELEKRASELRSFEMKHGPYSFSASEANCPLKQKQMKVEAFRARAEDEKAKYDKSISVTRAMTMNNLQIGMPHAFQAMTGFANVCTQAFEAVHNQARTSDVLHNVKMILP